MRYLPHTEAERAEMLQALGLDDTAALFDDIPEAVRLTRPLQVPGPLTEWELQRTMAEHARRNRAVTEWPCFLGGLFYDRFIPAAVGALAFRGEFATAYTPYQPELSQGTLASIYEFQSMIASLTGMAVAQASMYDGASALAEAILLAMGATGRKTVVLADGVFPELVRVVATYVAARGGRLWTAPADMPLEQAVARVAEDPAAVVMPMPDVYGRFLDGRPVAAAAHARGALAVAVADPVALALVEPPGAMGFDIAVGEGQPLGNALSYGGPTFGFFAVTEQWVRRLPGRLVGQARDVDGRRGFVLTLQAREQHIRREKATSNICSNHALNALQATIYLSLLGPEGLREVARLSAAKMRYLVRRLEPLGIRPARPDAPYLYEVAFRVPGAVADLNRHLLARGIIGGADLGRYEPAWSGLWQVAVTEKRTRDELDRLVEGVRTWMSR
jgi:glycine dehydrogenase subunit 1